MVVSTSKIGISVIVPTHNESKVVADCLLSLLKQSAGKIEIVIVDDGSTDDTAVIAKNTKNANKSDIPIRVFSQPHQGPGVARNLGASRARGEILVFVDADMTFKEDFLEKLIAPIKAGNAIGTDSQGGVLANPENFWARCWNMGKFTAVGNYSRDYLINMTPNKKGYGGVFRAILRKEFVRIGGFDTDGDYTDDTSLARKLGVKARIADAKFYHCNPDTLYEVWLRARWIGAGKNFTTRRYINLLRFFPPLAIAKGIIIGSRFGDYSFVLFKIVYDTAVWVSLLRTL